MIIYVDSTENVLSYNNFVDTLNAIIASKNSHKIPFRYDPLTCSTCHNQVPYANAPCPSCDRKGYEDAVCSENR